MAHQQYTGFQLDLQVEAHEDPLCQYEYGDSVSDARPSLEGQLSDAKKQERALTENLMRVICSRDNFSKAYKQVKRNKGAAGVDQVPVGNFASWYHSEGDHLITQLLSGCYRPSAVRSVSIPKANGGTRMLGIPTVKDRIVQQAICQVLSAIFDPTFSAFSYGFRPKRNTHQALKQASAYVEDGRIYVVDMDMKSFFDEVNHDRLMYRLSQKISDKNLLRLIRYYLQSGILEGGITSVRIKGTPQGSPLSPLLSNIVLDELDKELESRGHKFVRYADDFSIFVRSQEASERVKRSISNFLTNKLKLKVNQEKSVACKVNETKLLGYTIWKDGSLLIAQSSIKRLKTKVRTITKRNRGRSLPTVVNELNPVLRGWYNYYKHARCTRLFRELDAWIRRKLRCYRLKQCKKVIGLQRFLKRSGLPTWQSWILALSGKGWWRKSSCPQAHQVMNLDWFRKLGLFDLSSNYKRFKDELKPPCTRVRTVV